LLHHKQVIPIRISKQYLKKLRTKETKELIKTSVMISTST